MRNMRVLRVPSTRDLCIFCATRQLAAADVLGSPSLSSLQRRHLNSSSRAPSYAEGQLFKDEAAPSRPLTQAERMRATLQAQVPARPPPQPQRQAPQHNRPRQSTMDKVGPNQSIDRSTPVRRVNYNAPPKAEGHRPSRYNVKMDSRPQVNTPAFGAGHLRRRNELPPRRAPPMEDKRFSYSRAPPPARREKLDEAELAQLLGDNSTRRVAKKAYAPLSRETGMRPKCWNCGGEDHRSFDCPSKPALKQTSRSSQRPPVQQQQQQQQQQHSQKRASLADAAEAWIQREGAKNRNQDSAPQAYYETDRKAREAQDRRKARFAVEDAEPVQVKNRYEEPERRQRGGVERRFRGRIMREEEEEEDHEYIDRGERKRQRKAAKEAKRIAKAEPTPVYLPEYVSVANLASILKVKVDDFVMKLEELGFEDVQNDHILNAEHAGLVAQEYNFEPIIQGEQEDGDLYPSAALSPEDYANLPPRPPVVTIMGHVDHGKTTILDYMRSTSVAATEFGGITQHIGAFSVPLANGKKITFLDTPGHAAFETMRARGANVTDIVVLVVAADDSVMPQTVEAIKHAQAAKVPMIVAINKIDKQQADPDAVKLDLGRHGIEIEDFGGDVQAVCVSGKTGQGIPDLEEAISTLSETLDHRADPEANVEGWVLEGTTKKSGRVATVLVRSGTLRTGDILVAGTTWTRVRSLRNEAGVMVKEVGPGIAVEVDGWRHQPIAGDEVLQAEDEQQAASVSELRSDKVEREQMARDMEAINEARRLEAERREAQEVTEQAAKNASTVFNDGKKAGGPELVSFIVKGDVSGSVEAVIDSLTALGNGEVGTRILRHGVGSPSEFDVQHAADAQGHIVNFNTSINPNIAALAEEKGVKIIDSNIIYRVVEMTKDLLSEKLTPNIIQKVTGEAEIAAIFEIGMGGKKKMKVAGSKVRNGAVDRGTKARVLRGEQTIFDGVISSLKSQKKDVEQMRKDTECGIAFADWENFKVGDKIQCYEEKQEKRSL